MRIERETLTCTYLLAACWCSQTTSEANPTTFLDTCLCVSSIVLKTVEPKPKLAGLTGLMVDRFKPVNKPNRLAGL
jgi:hypothetical protein